MPFHLCTGPVFQFIDPDRESIQVWFRNRVSAPPEMEIHAALSRFARVSIDDYLTDAFVVNSCPDLRDVEREAVKGNNAAGIGFASLQNPGFRVLNELVTAHQMIRRGPYVSGINSSWPRTLSDREIHERIVAEILLIGDSRVPVDRGIMQNVVAELDKLPLGLQSGSVGDTRDYSADELVKRAFLTMSQPEGIVNTVRWE